MIRTRRPVRESIDWAAVRARMQSLQATASLTDVSAERARAIMDARARQLATPEIDDSVRLDAIEAVTFVVGSERYAIDTTVVREIVRLTDFTPVPGAPDFVVGVTNHRGHVLCIVDLRSFFRGSVKGVTDLSRIIVLGDDSAELGLLADRTDEISLVPRNDILPAPTSLTGIGREHLLGVTRDAMIVLDGALLLRDPRLFIDQ